MTKKLSVVLLLCLAVVFLQQVCAAQDRLIELGPNMRIRMSSEEVERLVQIGKISNFFDVTDVPTVPKRNISTIKVPPAPRHQALVNSLLPRLKVSELHRTISDMSGVFTRYYTTATGKETAEYLHAKYSSFAKGRSDIEVAFFQHTWLQPSVIARIKGKGPNADEHVILGGHEDSINGGASGRAPGADDDASGTATVLEVFRTLVESGFEPDRTVEFHAYAAEEVGLRGSQAIASAYREQGIKIAGMMQLDMTAYTTEGKEPVVGLMQDYVDPALTAFVAKLIDTYANIGWTGTRCGYACSDHASWWRMGYPTTLPAEGLFEDSNPNIHSSRDTLAVLNLEHAIEYSKIGLAYAVEMALN